MLTQRHRGFTIVELMVTVAVVAILAALAAPSMSTIVANNRIRAASQSLQSGLALARSEAVRLNTQVEFVLTGSTWSIERASDGTVLHEASGREVGSSLDVTRTPADADRITFNAFGLTVSPNANGSAPLTRLDLEAANPPSSTNYRPMAIQLLAGGMTRLCDPHAASTEPKACL